MKNIITILSQILFILILSGCSSVYLKTANQKFENMAYHSAIINYEKYLAEKKNAQAMINLAESYKAVNNTVKAEEWFRKVVELPKAGDIHYLQFAEALKSNEKYGEAKEWASKYIASNPNDVRALNLYRSCDYINKFTEDSFMYEVKVLNINNNPASNFSPTYFKQGLVFSSERGGLENAKINEWTGNYYLDLFYSSINENGEFSKPELLKGTVNGIYHEGPATFNKEGTLMYFTRSNYIKKKLGKTSNLVNNLKIFSSKLLNNEWNDIEEFPYNSDDFSTGHPTITDDGNTMYFISDRPGGYGGTDLYVSHLISGKWSEPELLPELINTNGNEMFPFVVTNYDTTILYFSSNGLEGMGGLDIYKVYLIDNKWMRLSHLTYPINSARDDFGFIADKEGKSGYFSSSREGDSGVDMLYKFSEIDIVFDVEGVVVSKTSGFPVPNAIVTLMNRNTNTVESVVSDANGNFRFEKLPRDVAFNLTGKKENFFRATAKLTTVGLRKPETLSAKLELEEIVIDKAIRLDNIYYDYDKADIRSDAAVELDKLVKVMDDNPEITIELSSHTDSRGKDDYNMRLSQKRAESAVKYIISRGVEMVRISAKGYGESRLLNNCGNKSNCTEEEHQLNRRTEFKVTRIKQ